ncbi:general secretion pathway protein A [Candidatus Magnetomoraceae bacterium gMMP-15]
MYTSYFQLKENPFNLTPDPDYLFLSKSHKEALSHLRYGINERKGFIVITGNIGTGKTTLLRTLLAELDSSIKSALIFNAFISDKELLQTINQEFGISSDKHKSKKQCIDALNTFLLDTFTEGGNAVVFLDEAQNLSPEVMEQIRMLSNLETEKEKLLQIIFVGQSELKELLSMPGLRQLNERITVRYDLQPLKPKDIKAYVEHRLVVAGAGGSIHFKRGAFKSLYAFTGGNPRLINAICDRALLIAYSKDQSHINSTIIKQADVTVRGEGIAKNKKNFITDRKILIFAFVFFAIIACSAGWFYKDSIGAYYHKISRLELEITDKTAVQKPPPKKQISEPIIKKPQIEKLKEIEPKVENSGIKIPDSKEPEIKPIKNLPEVVPVKPFKKPFKDIKQEPKKQKSLIFDPNEALKKNSEQSEEVRLSLEMETKVPSGMNIITEKNSINSLIQLEFFIGDPWERGMTTPEIMWVQKTLKDAGYELEVTGIYDEQTIQSIKNLQGDFALEVDGIIGPESKWALYQLSTTKIFDFYKKDELH